MSELRDRYIEHVLEGADHEELEDMARCHLENSLPEDEQELREHIIQLGLDFLLED